MTAGDRPHWLDVVSDLLTHLTMADEERSAEGTVLARILSISILEVLAAQSQSALAGAQGVVDRDGEPGVAETLKLELHRRRAAKGTAIGC